MRHVSETIVRLARSAKLSSSSFWPLRLGRRAPCLEYVPRRAELIARELRSKLLALANGQAAWPLYLYGPTGTGKTCAVLWLLDQVPNSAYVLAEELADAAYRLDDFWWLHGRSYQLVVVDEVGLRTTAVDREYLGLKRMADLRLGMPTIWISNLSPEQLRQHFDDRIYSRLCCGTVIRLGGKDRRFEEVGGHGKPET